MNAALTLFTRFAGFIESLKKTIAAASVPVQGRPARLVAPFGLLFHKRLTRLTSRLRDLLARIEAERASRRRIARPRATHPSKPKPAPKPAPILPRRFGWITQPIPESNGYAQHLRELLCEPEMEALIASDPRIGRILRPLCHMLGIDLNTIYRMIPRHRPTRDQPIAPPPADPTIIPDPWLTRRHPLLPEKPSNAPRNNPDRPPRIRRPPPPNPLAPPFRAPTLDDVQLLLDRVFGGPKHTQSPDFAPPNFLYVHPK
ncbi:MAG: hypothetical protein PHT60_10395 [Acidiphilium sp.]|nr:hypothetical protein [Acidiphilium sp.]MDD4936169.1 hypothetical protein [Acidiphilium sp.]